MGQTLNNTGNVSKLIVSLAGITLVQSFLNRLVCIRLIMDGNMIFMQTVKAMVSWHGLDEPQTSEVMTKESERNRKQKLRLVRYVYAGAVVGGRVLVMWSNVIFSGLLWLKIRGSQTTFQSWVFWYVQDLVLNHTASFDFLIYPSMWLVVALNYRMDIILLTDKIQQLTQMKRMGVRGERPVVLFRNIRNEYLRLARQPDVIANSLRPGSVHDSDYLHLRVRHRSL